MASSRGELADLENQADQLALSIHRPLQSRQDLDASIASAELLMRALQFADSKTDQLRLTQKCQCLLSQAERVKTALGESGSSSRAKSPSQMHSSAIRMRKSGSLSTTEQLILLESSMLNGFVFRPWDSPPDAREFTAQEAEEKYIDAPVLRLSKLQETLFDGWKRPEEIFRSTTSEVAAQGPTMVSESDIDLMQDVTTDCSVVASLCSLVAQEKEKLSKILSLLIFPYDSDGKCPAISENGKYIFRFYLNGCFRKVVVDDLLPTSRSERTLHVVDRSNRGLLWPALVEKAYLKVRGGYDFPGSNSGTDTWVLTGWIPEQVFLRSPNITPEDLWRRIRSSFKHGDVLITIGTGRLTGTEEVELDLVGEHDYAVLELREISSRRFLRVKNPWSGGMVWKGAPRIADNPEGSPELLAKGAMTEDIGVPLTDSLSPGSFWIDFGHVMQDFESMYLNWNPKIFPYHQDIHFKWNIKESPLGSFRTNPQYSLKSEVGGVVWVLLSRHLQTETLEYSSNSDTGLHTRRPCSGFVSIYAFARGGCRVLLSEDALYKGAYVDAPQTLLRLNIPPKTTYTIVVSHELLPTTSQSFTLSAYSLTNLNLQPASDMYTHWTSLSSAWTPTAAGGNSTCWVYTSNPQFSLSLQSTSDIGLLIETTDDEVFVHVTLFRANGERVSRITSRNVIADSGEYRRGCALMKTQDLDPGTYTIICSTFQAGQLAKFSLHVGSSGTLPCLVQPIRSESAGRYSLSLPRATFPAGITKISIPICFRHITRLRLVARSIPLTTTITTTKRPLPLWSPLKLSLQQDYTYETLAQSNGGQFAAIESGDVKIPDVDLTPSYQTLTNCYHLRVWVVLERQHRRMDEEEEEVIEVEVLSDTKMETDDDKDGKWQEG